MTRSSTPPKPRQLCSDADVPELEARNGLLQFDEIRVIAESAFAAGAQFQLTPAPMLRLHEVAVRDIYSDAGQLRDGPVYIGGTGHIPPPAEEVPGLVEEMCSYVNDNWNRSPIHISAYLMWRLNWIHPFFDGNGRTSRAISYLALLIKLGYLLPGTNSIPEQVAANKQPYYEALDHADAAWLTGIVDVSVMEQLLEELLARQLVTVVAHAQGLKP